MPAWGNNGDIHKIIAFWISLEDSGLTGIEKGCWSNGLRAFYDSMDIPILPSFPPLRAIWIRDAGRPHHGVRRRLIEFTLSLPKGLS